MNSEKLVFVKTKPGIICPFPHGKVANENGIWVNEDSFLFRRLRDKDVHKATAPNTKLGKTKKDTD